MYHLENITSANFETKALELFRFQAKNIPVYKEYLHFLNIDFQSVKSIQSIPFLPISFFKTHQVLAEKHQASITFLSSGTGNSLRSKHLISDISIYEKSFINGFENFYGNISEYCIQALLPSYIENGNSSLIYMINRFIEISKNDLSSFVSEEQLLKNIPLLHDKKVLLIGVSYALLDLAEKQTLDLSNYIVMETGGMKGRRKEWTRRELHTVFQKSFQVKNIHSEYGMTELLSQAYSQGEGIFKTPLWMKVSTRPLAEPFSPQKENQTGVLKIIDLANIYSCAFIETADLGKVYDNGNFEVIGRVDFEDIRGCNLLIH